MDQAPSSSVEWGRKQQELPATEPLNLWGLARKTILLNLGIVISGLAISWFQRRPDVIMAVALLVALMSTILWFLTLSFMALVSLYRIILRHRLRWLRQLPRRP